MRKTWFVLFLIALIVPSITRLNTSNADSGATREHRRQSLAIHHYRVTGLRRTTRGCGDSSAFKLRLGVRSR